MSYSKYEVVLLAMQGSECQLALLVGLNFGGFELLLKNCLAAVVKKSLTCTTEQNYVLLELLCCTFFYL